MELSFYEKVENSRKQWTPITPSTTEYCEEGASDTVSRCLSLKILELPVREFILDTLSREETKQLGEEAIAALIRNTEDEEKHDLALANCIKVCGDYISSYEAEAVTLAKEWIDHPDHPITKAAVLENGLFFVILPIYRRFGGEALRTTSLDISADEVNHVRIHRKVAKDLNHPPSKSLDDLRKATVAWLVEKWDVEGFEGSKFQTASDELMYKGITKELEFTQSFQVPAFFERRNTTLPYYA